MFQRLIDAVKAIFARPVEYETYDTESLTIDDTTGGVRIDVRKINPDTKRVVVYLETAQIRWQLQRDLTITAGGTEGSPLMEVGDNLTILGHDEIMNSRFIRTSGTSGSGQVLLQREVKN